MKEDKMVGWHYQLNRHEFEQAPEVGDGQGSLVCCSPWGRKESDPTRQLNNNNTTVSNLLLRVSHPFLFSPLLATQEVLLAVANTQTNSGHTSHLKYHVINTHFPQLFVGKDQGLSLFSSRFLRTTVTQDLYI